MKAREDEVGEPELPVEVNAAVTGAVVVVVAGAVVVVVVVDVVVVVEVAVVVEVVVVVDVAALELGVTEQQEVKVCGVPGAAALTPALSAAVEYSQVA